MSAASPVKLNQADLKITARSVEVHEPQLSDAVEYVSALNDTYEICRFIADPKYDKFREQMRQHISAKYEDLLSKARREPTPEETGDKYHAYVSERRAEITEQVRRFMASDWLDLDNMFFLDEAYLRSLMRLNEEDKLRVDKISLGSPLIITVILAAAPAAITAVWGVVQILDKIVSMKKTRLEIQKLKQELATPTTADGGDEDGSAFFRRLEKSSPYEKALYRRQDVRFRKTLIKIREIDVEIVEAE